MSASGFHTRTSMFINASGLSCPMLIFTLFILNLHEAEAIPHPEL